MRRYLPLAAAIVFVLFASAPARASTLDVTSSWSADTGGSTWYDTDATDYVGKSGATAWRSAVKFDISGIPACSVTSVLLYVNVTTAKAGHTARIAGLSTDPSTQTPADGWAAIAGGTEYVASSAILAIAGWRSQNLGATAASDLQNALGTKTWFAIGLKHTTEAASTLAVIDSNATANKPYLRVTFDCTGYNIPPYSVTDDNNYDGQTLVESGTRAMNITVKDWVLTAATITLKYWREGIDDDDLDGLCDVGEENSLTLSGTP
ncbi:MAG: hypothetical protein AB1742_04460, partial [bacterium]